jgi:hypothetical protein
MALCSPSVLAETGLTICLAEKCQTVNAFDAEQSVLCSPVCSGLTAKYGHYSGILVESRRAFSAVKTEWRRKEDSNLQYLFETCKSRRVRNLQGIKNFTNSPRLPARRAVMPTTAVSEDVLTKKPWRLCAENGLRARRLPID